MITKKKGVGSVLRSEELQLVGDGVGDGCSGER